MSPSVRLLITASILGLACGGVARAQAQSGEAMFEDNCSACHQKTGLGVPGAFPALAGDPFVVGPPAPVAATVLNGRGGMPTFKEELTDDQIATILSYVRSAWGNKASPVDVAVVTANRNGDVVSENLKSVLPYH